MVFFTQDLPFPATNAAFVTLHLIPTFILALMWRHLGWLNMK